MYMYNREWSQLVLFGGSSRYEGGESVVGHFLVNPHQVHPHLPVQPTVDMNSIEW
jgi:hypothetical protein